MSDLNRLAVAMHLQPVGASLIQNVADALSAANAAAQNETATLKNAWTDDEGIPA